MKSTKRLMFVCALCICGCNASHEDAPDTEILAGSGASAEMHAGAGGASSEAAAAGAPADESGPTVGLPSDMDNTGDVVVHPTPGEPGPRDAGAPTEASDGAVAGPVIDWPVPSGPIAEQLYGHWREYGQSGDCINLEYWYSFDDDGRVVKRWIDDDFCSGLELVRKVSGYYSLDDHLLSMVLDARRPDVWTDPTMPVVGEHQETFTIAFGERPEGEWGAAQTFLDGHAFVSTDGASFRSERNMLVISTDHEPISEENIVVGIEIDPPLPLAEGAACHVEITFSLTKFDVASVPQSWSDVMTIAFDATVGTDNGWKTIIANELAAAAQEDKGAAWEAMLTASGIDTHLMPFGWIFRNHVFPGVTFHDDDPNVLSTSLPVWGRWTRSEDPPPLL